MSLDLKNTLDAYSKALSFFVEEVSLENNLSTFEHLELMSNILTSLKLINNYIPIYMLNIKSLSIRSFDFNDSNLTERIVTNKDDLQIYVNMKDKDYYNNILHSISELIYFKILNQDSDELKKELSDFCQSALDIFLNRSSEELDKYALISDNNGNLLNYFTRGQELFSRAISTHILHSEISSYSSSSELEYTDEEYSLLKNSLGNLLKTFKKHISSEFMRDNNSYTYNLSNEDKINIILNEERLKSKYSYKLMKDTSNNIKILTNLVYLYEHSLSVYETSFDTNFDLTDDLDNTINDIKNFKDYKELIEALDSKSICDLERVLDEDITELTSQISSLENEINIYKSEVITGKRSKKDKPLMELLKFLFFLSQEQRLKTQMKKSLDSAEITYTQEHIDYSELDKKNTKALKSIKETDVVAKINIDDIKKSISRIYGLGINDIQKSLLDKGGSSVLVKFSQKSKEKTKFKENELINNTHSFKPTTIESSKAIDTMLKKKVNSVYTNSSSKFRNKEYRSLKVSEELKEHSLSNPTLDRLLDQLLNEADSLSKKKENTKNNIEKDKDDFQL